MKKMACKKFFVGVLLIIMFGTPQSFGQDMNFTFSSPESSLLVRGVTNPVNLNTGVVNVQVPLFSIQEGGLNLPVYLSYQTSGIKLHDIATWVGLGWNLSAGGKVTRIVKKRPDETGFCKTSSPDGAAAAVLSSWTDKAYDSRQNGDFDSEPDVFFYEFPGTAGMFVMDPEGNAHTIPYSNIKIEWIDKSYFNITDANGIVYKFGQDTKEETTTTVIFEGERESRPSYVSTWHLESITGVMYEKITFTYEEGDAYEFSNYDEKYSVEVSCTNPSNPTISSEIKESIEIVTRIKPQYLKNISWKGGHLEFLSSKERADIRNTRRLNSIKYFAYNGSFIKSSNFTYHNTTSSNNRLMLSEAYDSTAMGIRLISKFDYSSYTLAPRDSKDYDHWGYYNGARNQTNRPTINYLPSIHAPIPGANRSPVLGYASDGILKRIYNNLGGYTEYEYELNDAVISGSPVSIGGLRIKSIKEVSTSKDSLITKYYYKKCNAQGTMTNESSGTIFSGGSYCTWIQGGGGTYTYLLESQMVCDIFDMNGSPVCYSTVIVENPNGSRAVYDYTSNASAADVPSKVYYIPPSSSYVQDNNFAVFINSSRFWRRGLMTKQRSYDKDNNLMNEVNYYYSFGNNLKGEVKGYQTYTSRFVTSKKVIKTKHLCEYVWQSEPVFLKTIYSKGSDVIYTTTQYKYNEDYLVPVEITQSQTRPSTTIRTTITYPFNYPTTTTSGDMINQGIGWMNYRHMINYPIETITYKNNFVVAGELNEYMGGITLVWPKHVKHLKISEPKSTYVPYAHVSGKMVYDPNYEIISINEGYSLEAYAPTQKRSGLYSKPESVIYGYNNTVPIASVVNATVKQIYHTSFEDVEGALVCNKAKTGEKVFRGTFNVPLNNLDPGQYVLSYWKSSDQGGNWNKVVVSITVNASFPSYSIGDGTNYIDEVRVHPAIARMTTMTYKPGIGKVSDTDENGFTTYYEYDGFGRIVKIMDNDHQVLKNYLYTVD
jgi:YD repeat protein